MLLEQAYQDLQSALITTRQAMAQAIFTEKQFEQQIKKNLEQVNVWEDRVKMAKSQAHLELVRQAENRQKQYQSAAHELSSQLEVVRRRTLGLRDRLTELETESQKTYTKKQVLIARSNAAAAIDNANKLFDKLGIIDTDPLIDQIESKVSERELSLSHPGKILTEERTQEIMLQSIKTIEQSNAIIERMEKLIIEREAEAYQDKEPKDE